MKCKHVIRMRAHRVEFAPGVESPYIDRNRKTGKPIRSVLVDCCVCLHCGAWLPLGPSNDEDERVKVEMRAAELVVIVPDSLEETILEWAGRRHFVEGHEEPNSFGGQAGWLAAAIATHGGES